MNTHSKRYILLFPTLVLSSSSSTGQAIYCYLSYIKNEAPREVDVGI